MKITKIAALAGALITSPFVAAEGTKEVLMGVDILPNSIELHVASGGCTSANSFTINVDKTASPHSVTVLRVQPDFCEAHIPDGIKVSFDRAALGLDGKVEFILTNKIGNTSTLQ
ncbi:hypothetical protein H0A36_19485 [Endozoicomonas sp. SM1973]|uniref:DUF1573 domain-containing protein n=1 Tax=Spartinivicinus marinus TaxID=2994442 RepID=A0A853IGD3_9GAMM|nr:hypothetical protein [Spartinivicinus marinus]MCX4027550.1 hypothetical protein [Spartinivicinus marinus]NYZ68205.1 hypothetical protein [Spartinivicinus marinus]